jgi:hypothetical protein
MTGKNWKLQIWLRPTSTNPKLSKKIIRERMGKIGRGSQIGAWRKDGLTDWLTDWLTVGRNNFDFDFWGGLEYLHRSPVSRKRRRKGNTVPGGITGPPCSWGIKIRWPGSPGWGSLKNWDNKIWFWVWGIQTSAGLSWRGQAATINYRPVLSSDRVLQKNKPATV